MDHSNSSSNEEVIWLLGDGRSGTTWVSNLINYDESYRELFEPFHPAAVSDMSFLRPHEYVRQGELSEPLTSVAEKVFSGTFTHSRVNQGKTTFSQKNLLVKDIFSNLLSHAVINELKNIKPVLLVRNPFAVALSKYKKRNWFWATEPKDFLQQAKLMEDFLHPFESLISEVSEKNNYIYNQVLIWCIIHYVPLKQFNARHLHVCCFEDIFQNPNDEISSLMGFVRGAEIEEVKVPSNVIQEPSWVTLGQPVPKLLSWKQEIPQEIINYSRGILDLFGLDDLYKEGAMPNKGVITSISD